jgi:ADP-ribose pyrophosphatase YjhB (NUDIX family)
MSHSSADGKDVAQSFTLQVPDGDTHERDVCDSCGFVNYINPKIVVGAVIAHEKRFVMCKRAIEPRLGYWTIPAGYLEQNETSMAGAKREAFEEACADIEILSLLAVYNIPRISQVQLIYKAHLNDPAIDAGLESLEVKLVAWEDIPWDDLAFPSVHWALNHYAEVAKSDIFAPFSNPPGQSGNELPPAIKT